MGIYTAPRLVLVRPLRLRRPECWEAATHIAVRCRPPMPSGEMITTLSECRLYRVEAEEQSGELRATFMVEFLFRQSGPLRAGQSAACRRPVELRVALPKESREGWLPSARGTVHGAALLPDRRELVAAVSLAAGVETGD